jgi:hypothetical protein
MGQQTKAYLGQHTKPIQHSIACSVASLSEVSESVKESTAASRVLSTGEMIQFIASVVGLVLCSSLISGRL